MKTRPDNIFVDEHGIAKLGDFDVSKDEATRVTLAQGTIVGFSTLYLAPELQAAIGNANVRVTRTSDIYSFVLNLLKETIRILR